MKGLKPVDFKAVAAKGCYVYCYLRADRTPYYVGIASNAYRPTNKNHNCRVPGGKSLWRIRVMKSGLSWEDACVWEQRYILRYGRKDLGTGCLWNLTDGGDGVLGRVVPQEQIDRATPKSRMTQILACGAHERFGVDAESWAALSRDERTALRMYCTDHPEVSGADYLEGNYTHFFRTEKGREHQLKANAVATAIKKKDAADRWGLSEEDYRSLTPQQLGQFKIWVRRNEGKTAQDWLELTRSGEFDTYKGSKVAAESKGRAAAKRNGVGFEAWKSLTRHQRDKVTEYRKKGKDIQPLLKRFLNA